MDINDKDKIKGLVATIVFHGIIIVVLACACLYYSYPPKDKDLLEPEKEDILFGGEYVMLAEAVQEETENASEGAMAEDIAKPEPVVTQDVESPMKVKPVDKISDEPTAEELAAEAERVRKEKETAEKINKRMGGMFKNTSTESNVTADSHEEKITARTSAEAPGVSGLEGYTLDNWVEAKSSLNGIVKIRVEVDSRGKVTSARYDGGSGSAAGSPTVRRNCEQAAMKCRFSVPENTITKGVGVLTYKFTPKK